MNQPGFGYKPDVSQMKAMRGGGQCHCRPQFYWAIAGAIATCAIAMAAEKLPSGWSTGLFHSSAPGDRSPSEGTLNREAAASAEETPNEDARRDINRQDEVETTTWKGTLNAGFQKLKLEVDLTPAGDSWKGELCSVDQNNARFPLSDVVNDGKQLKFSVAQLGASFEGELSDNGKSATGKFRQSGMEFDFTLELASSVKATAEAMAKETLREAWVGKLELGAMQPVMQFRVMKTDAGETKAYFDSITEGRTGFPASYTMEDGKLIFEVDKIRLKFEGTLSEDLQWCEGTWSQGGRTFPLALEKQNHVFDKQKTWDKRPQKPTGPFSYESIDVRFENRADKVTLAGTLTVPRKDGRHPVVVLISGSGQQDRDETLMEHKPFLVLADYLSSRGIAVLRYDDRGFGESTGAETLAKATTEDFARDASAAVDFLLKHEQINPRQIGLCGHSEGGLIAPMVAGMREDLAFIVLMAAPGVSGPEIVKSQSEAMLRAMKMPEDQIRQEMQISRIALQFGLSGKQDAEQVFDQALQGVMDQLKNQGEGTASQLDAIRTGSQMMKTTMQRSWMQFFLRYDPKPALRKIRCPVLAIQGSKDLQVLPELNVPHIREALEEGKNPDFEIVTVEGLNHMFQQCETGAPGEYYQIDETFNPEALKIIADWIGKRVEVVR